MKKKSNEEFLSLLKKRNINYIPTEQYNGSKNKIKFLCEKHGIFEARPNDILQGQGCPICGGTHKYSTEDFIEKAKYVHNNFFSYDNAEYINSYKKIKITCPIHGDFEQKASNHLQGQNCPLCAKEKIKHKISKLKQVNKTTKKITTEKIKKRIIEKFEGKYLTDKVVYKSNNDKITLICKTHGDFEITPNHLFQGRGCPKCSKNHHYTNEEFISLCKQMYGDKFSYEKTKYISTHKNVIITCKIHGDFEIMPSNFLRGEGCPNCHSSKLEEIIKNELDTKNIKYLYNKHYKILNNLQLDFYIPSKNIAIECQGIQHFFPISFFGGEKTFKELQKRDETKRKLCEENNIKLLYFSFSKNTPYNCYNNVQDLFKEIMQ